jgi:hypothetical protein
VDLFLRSPSTEARVLQPLLEPGQASASRSTPSPSPSRPVQGLEVLWCFWHRLGCADEVRWPQALETTASLRCDMRGAHPNSPSPPHGELAPHQLGLSWREKPPSSSPAEGAFLVDPSVANRSRSVAGHLSFAPLDSAQIDLSRHRVHVPCTDPGDPPHS